MKGIMLPVILFTLSMTATPGPNNMLLTVTGARFGFKKTLPMIAGIVLGIVSQLLLSAWGLGVLFQNLPLIQDILKIAGSLYIFYLAIKTAFPGQKKKQSHQKDSPMGLLQSAGFQYLNPKAYIMTITAMSVYPLEGELYLLSTLFILISFLIICPISISLWAGFGSLLNGWINDGTKGKWINYGLGMVTASSVIFILL